MNDIAKWQLRDPDAVWLYVWVLGYFGGHDFLLGRPIAWLKLIFCWTGVPAIVAIVQLFTIRTWIRNNNARWTDAHQIQPNVTLAFTNWFPIEYVMRIASNGSGRTPSAGALVND